MRSWLRDLAGLGSGRLQKPNQQEEEGTGAGQLNSLTHSPKIHSYSVPVSGGCQLGWTEEFTRRTAETGVG